MGGAVRRAIGTLVTLALVAAALGFYIASPRLSVTSGEPPVTNAEPASPATSSQYAAPSPTATGTTTPATTRGRNRSPDRDLPPGPGGREPGIRLTATPTAQGRFDVVETVRLAAPVTQLTLAPPDLTAPAVSPSLHRMHPAAEGLVLTAGDSRVKLANDVVRRATEIPIAEPTDRFQLRYQLRGVTAISAPSSAGRRLAGVGPLLTGVPDELPVAITIRGHSIRNLSCPCLAQDDQACAAGRQPKLRVNRNLARRDALVEVQFDIPVTQVGAPG
jgi:hypothetical protein